MATETVPRQPSDSEIKAAGAALEELTREVAALGDGKDAAPLHYAMGHVYGDRLGDLRSAAVCYQNAFQLDPSHGPTLEAARQMFLAAGVLDKVLALHEREEALLVAPAERAESLRAQAALLLQNSDSAEAARRIHRALELAPDHPALLAAAVDTARADKPGCARLLVRFAGAVRDDVQKAQLLRSAVLLVEEIQAERTLPGFAEGARPHAAELDALHEDALRKLHSADPKDPVGVLGLLHRARARNDWEAVLRLCRERAERTGGPSEHVVVANVAAHRLGKVAEAMAELRASLEDDRRDPALLAVRASLAEQQRAPDLADALRARAAGTGEPTERADLKIAAAALVADPVEQEQLLSEALADNPGDAAAIAQHARLVARRDPIAAAERFAALAQALAEHAPAEAAGHYLEAGALFELAAQREDAARMARNALALAPRGPSGEGALRLLQRTVPFLGGHAELASLLEQAAQDLPRAAAAELLARAAALLSDVPPPADGTANPRAHALELAQRAAGLARGLTTPRSLESWTALALRSMDLTSLSAALEARAESTQGADAADLLVEAAELSRATGDEARALELFRRARAAESASEPARRGLLALPLLPDGERIELLAEEARTAEPARAAALHAERAALLEGQGRFDEAVEVSAQALALGGADLAVLRRLARLQIRRGDHPAALAVLAQIAEAVPEGSARGDALARAAEFAEWKAGDAQVAVQLYAAAADAHPGGAYALVQLARLQAWMGRFAEAAQAYEQLAQRSQLSSERVEALRWAAALQAHRCGQPAKAAELYRQLLAESAGDLEAIAALLQLIGDDPGRESRIQRADLRGRLASRCQDPRCAALLRVEAARDRMEAGDGDQAVAEYRRALALNPQDRIALDLVDQALRSAGTGERLAEHLAFRAAYAEGPSRAALALQQGELLEDAGHLDAAAVAYRQALDGDSGSVLAVHGARRVAARIAERNAGAKDGGAADARFEPDRLVEVALLEQHLGHGGAAQSGAGDTNVPVELADQPSLEEVDLEVDAAAEAGPDVNVEIEVAAESPPEAPLTPDSLHEMVELARSSGREDAAVCAASVLVALGMATAEETDLHSAALARPPRAELPRLGDDDRLRAPDDGGSARELLASASAALVRAFPAELAGRGDRVKGDNPVRRICAAIARALGIEEPVLYVAKREPEIVLPTATEPPGVLVGLEVPKRYHSRQQRFLYARALAHIRRGTHAAAALPPDRLAQVVAELARLAAPQGTDLSRLPAPDAAVGRFLAQALAPEERGALAALAEQVAAEARPEVESLAFAIRETAERAALVICGDPAAGLAIVISECAGGLERPEVARLARFAVSEAYLSLRG
ncbi:MAG: tetratricopeptide repeat protein [Myxococcales bacterium]